MPQQIVLIFINRMYSRTIVSMNFGFNFANGFHQIHDDFIFVGVDRIIHTMAIRVGLWRFQMGGTKLERFLHKNQHTYSKNIIEF